MHLPARRSFGVLLGVLAFLGPLGAVGRAQFNPYINPFFGGAGFGGMGVAGGWAAGPFGAGGFGLRAGGGGFGGFNSPMARLGYGAMGRGFGGMGGMGGLGANALMAGGAGFGYGMGFGMGMTQWMMNPYEGYLQGAADITRANADYQRGIQQAKVTRQEAKRSSLETRRALIEEAEWERAHMPDPEKIRQAALERELTIARTSPPLNEVFSARALNALLRHLVTQQGDGVRGPRVPLNPDTVKHINVQSGNTSGNVSLLKNEGKLEWPDSLLGEIFKNSRERINSLMGTAYTSVNAGNNPDDATLQDLLNVHKKMAQTLDSNIDRLKPTEYLEANRYLGTIQKNITALQNPDIGRQFNKDLKPKANHVAELVKHMREKGLQFAPAAEDDRAAYLSLYHALASFDAGTTREVSTDRGGDNK